MWPTITLERGKPSSYFAGCRLTCTQTVGKVYLDAGMIDAVYDGADEAAGAGVGVDERELHHVACKNQILHGLKGEYISLSSLKRLHLAPQQMPHDNDISDKQSGRKIGRTKSVKPRPEEVLTGVRTLRKVAY